jgi:hypothetical protein
MDSGGIMAVALDEIDSASGRKCCGDNRVEKS